MTRKHNPIRRRIKNLLTWLYVRDLIGAGWWHPAIMWLRSK